MISVISPAQHRCYSYYEMLIHRPQLTSLETITTLICCVMIRVFRVSGPMIRPNIFITRGKKSKHGLAKQSSLDVSVFNIMILLLLLFLYSIDAPPASLA